MWVSLKVNISTLKRTFCEEEFVQTFERCARNVFLIVCLNIPNLNFFNDEFERNWNLNYCFYAYRPYLIYKNNLNRYNYDKPLV